MVARLTAVVLGCKRRAPRTLPGYDAFVTGQAPVGTPPLLLIENATNVYGTCVPVGQSALVSGTAGTPFA